MEPSIILILVILGLIGIYGAALFASIYWTRRQRKTRWPFKGDEKLLRSPGETLKRRIAEMDETFMMEFFGTVGGILLSLAVGGLLTRVLELKGAPATAVCFLPPLLLVAISAARVTRIWRRRSNHFMGWFGERLTAEHLRPLQQDGYRVFHDVPAEAGKHAFNLDHVVVGVTGVVVVETKTRRKGNARPGMKDHEVVFNGQQIVWPSGEDRKAIDQTIAQADWLTRWVEENTGLKVQVKRVLTLPGWFVRESPSQMIRVVNPKILPDVIRGRGEVVLTPGQVDQIARQLERICRDVSD